MAETNQIPEAKLLFNALYLQTPSLQPGALLQ